MGNKKNFINSNGCVFLLAYLLSLAELACSHAHKGGLEVAPISPSTGKSSEATRHQRMELNLTATTQDLTPILSAMVRLKQPLVDETTGQPSELYCTGFYIGDGLVLTAGTCVKNCATLKMMWIKPGTLSTTGGNETTCAEIVGRSDTEVNDYALIKVKETSKLPPDFIHLSLNTTVTGKREVSMLSFASGSNEKVWLSSGCFLNGGAAYEGNLEGIDSHDCDVDHGSQGALLFSKSERSPLALFSKQLDGINRVTGFKKIIVPAPVPALVPPPVMAAPGAL